MNMGVWDNLGAERVWRQTLLLRFAVACCFIGHGTMAIQVSGNFGSEWSSWVRMFLPSSIEYEASRMMLLLIGTLDIVDGVLLLLPRIPRHALVWVLGWGFLTAMSRLVFLGVYAPPFAINGFHAIAEMVKRVPNWMLPLFLVAMTSPGIKQSQIVISQRYKLLTFAVMSQTLSIFLNSSYEYQNPMFNFELLKIGMPEWYFWTITVLSLLGLLATALIYLFGNNSVMVRAGVIVVVVVYCMSEGFNIYSRNLPGGFFYAFVRFVSHMSMYTCLGMWAAISLRSTAPALARQE